MCLWRCEGGYFCVITLRVNRRGNGNMKMWTGPSTNLVNFRIFSVFENLFEKLISNNWFVGKFAGSLSMPWNVLYIQGSIQYALYFKEHMVYNSELSFIPTSHNSSLRDHKLESLFRIQLRFLSSILKNWDLLKFLVSLFFSGQQFMIVLTMKTKRKSWLL